MSERKTNSIGSRLLGHFDGKSKNVGLSNYRKVEPSGGVNFKAKNNFSVFREMSRDEWISAGVTIDGSTDLEIIIAKILAP